ncbi:MAG: single-stranded-DNA-specific exonuclease RecJ [Clostridia bacterium]|nr:single-stranded-DNA-specific exonuclease RecJ [Clostridia bacterium]
MEYNQALLDQIVNNLNVEKITAKCLLNCGLSSIEECEDFLNPSLDKLTKLENYVGLKEVVERIQRAIDNKERVLVFGDYDSDGICSCAMLKLFFKSKGLDADIFIPNRKEHGYGMSEEVLDFVTEEYDPDLFITVDCGIANVEEARYIYEDLGRDIVITDHHEPQDELPKCCIFNPHLSKDNGAYEHLCGAGVVLRLIEALSSFEESLKYYDIAAIATVADLVPLTKDNRAIVSYGLKVLNSKPRKGVDMLIKTFSRDKLNSTDIAFKLAPRLNAAGRLADANPVVQLFFEEDAFLLKSLVEEINEYHNERQNLTKKLCEEVEELMAHYDFDKYPIVVLYKKGWDEGILGITAAKITKDYNRPVILLTDALEGNIKGSGRSIETVNIFECVSNSNSPLLKFGGHSQACGLTLEKENIDLFRINLNKYFKEHYSNDVLLERNEKLFDFHEINNLIKVAKELEMLEPYGQANQKPLFESTIGNLNFKPMKEGMEHVVYKSGKFQMVGFYLLDKLDILNSAIEKSLVFTLTLSPFNNIDYVQALIKEVRCVSFDNYVVTNYILTALYPDKSIFHPKAIDNKAALELIKDNDYTTAYISYTKETFDEFKALCPKKLVENAHFIESPCPNNAIYFDIGINEDLTKYKNVVFLDRPISLGYIDELKLDKDCNVFYVENGNGLKVLRSYMLQYDMLGKVYLEVSKILQNAPNTSIYSIYVDIEKMLNLNYNSFIVAICIFMDLGIITKEGKTLKIQKNVKNPINNSRIYKFIMEG